MTANLTSLASIGPHTHNSASECFNNFNLAKLENLVKTCESLQAGGPQGWGSPPNIVFFYNGVSNNGSYPIVVSINSWGVGEVG